MTQEKINIAELLKDCPQGMELDCLLCNNPIELEGVAGNEASYPIRAVGKDGFHHVFTAYGEPYNHDDAKCVIFPKGKTTWEGFHRPFKDGDIVFTTLGNMAIIRKPIGVELFSVYGIMVGNCFYKDETVKCVVERHATEKEKQKLFDVIKAKGYRWNAETKTLEKLIEQKFDITTLKPFDKVLVRQNNNEIWGIDLFGFYNEWYYHTAGNCIYEQCVPYEQNEHLLGKTDDCDEYFKNW